MTLVNAYPVKSVTDYAWPRVAASEEPARYQELTNRGVEALFCGVDLIASRRDLADSVAIAAEIEALAGFRRLSAISHPITCRCDACCVYSRLRTMTREDVTP